MRLAAYPWRAPSHLRTKLERVDLTCVGSKREFDSSIAVFVNVAEHPAFETQLAQHRLNETTCPSCGLRGSVLVEGTVWFDPASWLIVEGGPTENGAFNKALPEFKFKRIRSEAGDVVAFRTTVWKHKIWPTPYGPNPPTFMELGAFRQWLLDAGIVLDWFDCFVLLSLFARQKWTPSQLAARFGPLQAGPRAALDRLRHAGFVIGDLDAINPSLGLDAHAMRTIEHPAVWFKDHEVVEPEPDNGDVAPGLPALVSIFKQPKKCGICAKPTPCPTHDRLHGGR